MKRLRIWHLSSNRWNSAVTEYALSCARASKLLGHEVMFTPLAGSPAEHRARAYGLQVFSSSRFTLDRLVELRKLGADFSPDWLVVYGGPETFLAKFLPSSRGILRFRGHDLKGPPSRTSTLLSRLSLSHVNTMLVPSEVYSNQLANYGLSHRKVVVVPLGIDNQKFARVDAPLRNPKELVIFGRLDPVKGHRDFIEIYALAKANWPESKPFPRLCILGEEANVTAGEVREWCRAGGLLEGQDYRLLTDRLEDVATFLSGSLIGVIPSLDSEVICRVGEEFLLCGVPLFVSGVGSLAELLYSADAGVNYSETTRDQCAAMLRETVHKALSESHADRQLRAEQAKIRFSLAAMAEKLGPILTS